MKYFKPKKQKKKKKQEPIVHISPDIVKHDDDILEENDFPDRNGFKLLQERKRKQKQWEGHRKFLKDSVSMLL